MKPFAVALTLLTTLVSGCGVSAVPTAQGPQAMTAKTAAKSVAKTAGLVLTKATGEVVVGAPKPGHNYPERERFEVAGTRDGRPFSLVLTTHNPGGNQYVANVETLTVNGKRVTSGAERRAIATELVDAADRQGNAFWAARHAAMIILVTH